MVARHVGLRRLERLADYLDKVPRKAFHYGVWREERSCGTVACALGHAASMPFFRRLGLRVEIDSIDPIFRESNPDLLLSYRVTDGHGQTEESAAMDIFCLDIEEARDLFIPGFSSDPWAPGVYATPKQVAKHIRRFVAHARKVADLSVEE